MELRNNKFISGQDIVFYPAIVKDISKSKTKLQPLFEAFTNSLESLKPALQNGRVIISIYRKELLKDELKFEKLTLEDNGVGFDDDNFERFCRFKDNRKGYQNRGCGRIQYLHFFEKAEFSSIYTEKQKYKHRMFILSKSKQYIDQNAIVFHIKTTDADPTCQENHTKLTFTTPLTDIDKKYYNKLTGQDLKKKLIEHYMGFFCKNRDSLPKIQIHEYVNNKQIEPFFIGKNDIPPLDKKDDFSIQHLEYSGKNNEFEYSQKEDKFDLRAYKIPKEQATENKIVITSKDELAQEIALDFLPQKDLIDNHRYLFLLSSDYIDNLDGNTRGEFEIKRRKDLVKDAQMHFEEDNSSVIVFEDIVDKTSQSICKNYPEINEKQKEHKQDIEKLKEMFLLNDETLKKLSISINEDEGSILKKVYKYDAEVIAQNDVKIKKQIEALDSLDPNSDDYQGELAAQIEQLVIQIPIQNRTNLTHYVARRKLVLDLFDRIINYEIKIKTNGKINESLLHNILFTQHDNRADKSDLWLINEDFIYFNGYSDKPLSGIEIDGVKLVKESFTKEEGEYLKSLGENRKLKRPDVLLFPKEGKCIILEFKNHDVNISDHLAQINKYAYWILNFCNNQFQLNTFYGYLIGEAIEPKDVRAADSDFIEDCHFDYLVRPTKKVVGENKKDGSLYTEVVKYSTLLKRAQLRNKIYIDKLTKNTKDDSEEYDE